MGGPTAGSDVQRIHWNQPHGYGLTDKGQAQAAALADRLVGVQFAALYCSPVLRAVQTAQIVGRRLDLTPQIVDVLRERDVGILEGTSIEFPSPAWQTIVQWMQHDNHDARTEGGESYNDIAARFMPLIDRLEDVYRDTQANVLLISHGTTLRTMLPHLLTNVDNAFSMARPVDGSFYVLAELRDNAWVCLRWGEEIMMGS